MSDEQIEKFGRWVLDTCALFGTTPETAFEVAAICTRSLRIERESATPSRPTEPT